jgi:hypothetical protein
MWKVHSKMVVHFELQTVQEKPINDRDTFPVINRKQKWSILFISIQLKELFSAFVSIVAVL